MVCWESSGALLRNAAYYFVREQVGIALFDVFKAQQEKQFLIVLQDDNIWPILFELQPLDITVNGEFKWLLKVRLTAWYADEVSRQLVRLPHASNDDTAATSVKVDLWIS